MERKSYLSISEFARLSGIKRANLIFYDRIGLLRPEYRGENEYRYYTRRQLGFAYLVVALRELGIGLEEIKSYAAGRTPEKMIELFESQEKRIRKEVQKLNQMSEIMKIYTGMVKDSLENKWGDIELQKRKREPVFMGPVLDRTKTEDEEMVEFYRFAREQNMELVYPLGAVVAGSGREEADAGYILHYYFKVKLNHNAYKPAGLYAVAYGRCGYGQSGAIYRRLHQYIEEHNLTVRGNAYEEVPLNEISTEEDQEYLVKVEIMVTE